MKTEGRIEQGQFQEGDYRLTYDEPVHIQIPGRHNALLVHHVESCYEPDRVFTLYCSTLNHGTGEVIKTLVSIGTRKLTSIEEVLARKDLWEQISFNATDLP